MRNRDNNIRSKVRKEKYYSSVTAIALFGHFSHSLNDFQEGFYFNESRTKSGVLIKMKKTKQQIVEDIHVIIKSIYPKDRYLAIDITFHT